jgi:hypothetical protein
MDKLGDNCHEASRPLNQLSLDEKAERLVHDTRFIALMKKLTSLENPIITIKEAKDFLEKTSYPYYAAFDIARFNPRFSPLASSLLEDYGLWNFKGLD